MSASPTPHVVSVLMSLMAAVTLAAGACDDKRDAAAAQLDAEAEAGARHADKPTSRTPMPTIELVDAKLEDGSLSAKVPKGYEEGMMGNGWISTQPRDANDGLGWSIETAPVPAHMLPLDSADKAAEAVTLAMVDSEGTIDPSRTEKLPDGNWFLETAPKELMNGHSRVVMFFVFAAGEEVHYAKCHAEDAVLPAMRKSCRSVTRH